MIARPAPTSAARADIDRIDSDTGRRPDDMLLGERVHADRAVRPDPGDGEVEVCCGLLDAIRPGEEQRLAPDLRPRHVGIDDRDGEQTLAAADAGPRIDQVMDLSAVNLPAADP